MTDSEAEEYLSRPMNARALPQKNGQNMSAVGIVKPQSPQSQDSEEERLLSLNSINESGEVLLKAMKGMVLTDKENLKVACKVAQQIVNLGRLKLEIYKLRGRK